MTSSNTFTAHMHSRRSFLSQVGLGTAAFGTLGFYDLMQLQAAELRKQGRALILLWMAGGPSQFETFDPKPGTENGGETKAISTSVSGIQIAQGWEQVAKNAKEIAFIRSMTNKEGNHQRASYQLHTGYAPSGSVKHPALGCSIAKEIADPDFDLPSVISIGANRALNFGQGAGFLGVDYEPFQVARAGQPPQNVTKTVNEERFQRRGSLLSELENDFASRGGKTVVENHKLIYGKASRLVLSPRLKAFDLSEESESLKNSYGDSEFGRGCLLARRLIEAGVTFVEVQSGGWDMHQDISDRMKTSASQVDPGFGTLIADLKEKGMLDKTLVVWMGEFGRTPRINARSGRDHYPRVFNAAIAGGGVKGGQVIGSSNKEGTAVKENPVEVGDLFASICHSLKVDPEKENLSPLGRPMRIVDQGSIIKGLFT